MKYKIKLFSFLFILMFFANCIKFKENPLDPTTPLGFYLTFLWNKNITKKIYVTFNITQGNIGIATTMGFSYCINGIEKADFVCNNDPKKPNNNLYKAMIVDGTNRRACSTPECSGGTIEHIDWVFKPNTSYYRADDTLLFTTNDKGIIPSTENIVNSITHAGEVYEYWTGLDTDWLKDSSYHCSN
ncbi:MAG: hypothetical protein KatS3mg129_0991 [Leptospiraceae bacterium]|nr:MAG: hypothetical protein KatS3mg129_0991 [Leptospiraceae bacterium]